MSETQTVVPIPITTRGIGIHSQLFYNLSKDIFGSELPCTVHQIYRVSLIQLDVRIQCCQEDNVFPLDPSVDVYYPLTYFREFNDFTMMPRNFSTIAHAINSVGNFMLNDVAYQPYVPAILEFEKRFQVFDNIDASDKDRISLNPYLITIQNLRQIASSLADPEASLEDRKRFISRNPIPGAKFTDDLLVNADDVMPSDYDFRKATDDILSFVELLKKFQSNTLYDQLIDCVSFQSVGHISILTSVHHHKESEFSLKADKMSYEGETTVRSFVKTNEQDQYDGSVNLMNEYPNFISAKDKNRWSMRSKFVSCSTYKMNWTAASDCSLKT